MLDCNEFEVVEKMINEIPFFLISFRGVNDRTLLMYAAVSSSVYPFPFLLAFEQDVTVVDRNGRNIAHYVVYRNNLFFVKNFEYLKRRTSRQAFHRLLNHVDTYGCSPLYHAARWNMHEAIKYLIQNKVNVNVRNNKGQLPEENKKCDEETKWLIRKCRKQW